MNRISNLKAKGLRTHYCKDLTLDIIGENITVCGWVVSVRSHGENLNFVDLKDVTGVIQIVFKHKISYSHGDVLKVSGHLQRRPEGTENPALFTGEIELIATSVKILSEASALPIPTDEHTKVDENMRLRYRYLDLRTQRMQKNIIFKADLIHLLRNALANEGFIEIDTPLLWVPTPEGAREFLVPSRLSKGSFYALPQSPQIAKQLLMVSGFDRYFQFAKCLRDEDLRADRQFEFTQLDLETSFMTAQDIMDLISHVLRQALNEIGLSHYLTFKKMTFAEAYRRFGTDKPDMSIEQELIDVSKIFESSELKALAGKKVVCLKTANNQFSRTKLDNLVTRAKELGAEGLLWIKLLDDNQIESPVAKYLKNDEITQLIQMTNSVPPILLLFVAGNEDVFRVLGQIRLEIRQDLTQNENFNFVWVDKFPLFEKAPQGTLVPAHHPFTMPDLNTLSFLETQPEKVLSESYDLVLNGWELGSGSLRIHDKKLQQRVFKALGLSEGEMLEKFGFLLEAFSYGVPPHGGFAIGIDRLTALLLREASIREVIAFPKSQSGIDPMTGAPKPVPENSLKELGISLKRS
jgi:aspartyl-tRNA synthetase